MNKLMKPREAANYLGLSAQTLYKDRKKGGKIPWTKVEGSIRYEKEQLDRYIEARRVNVYT